LRHQLLRVAYRVAENRVVAGLHYPMDSLAGQLLGVYMAHYFLWRAASPKVPIENAHFKLFGEAEFELKTGEEEPVLDRPLSSQKQPGHECVIDGSSAKDFSPILNWLFNRAVEEWKR
jgi:hypothetical protein